MHSSPEPATLNAGVNFYHIIHTHTHNFATPPVPASRNEYQSIRLQLESETFPAERPGDPPRSFHSLPPIEQAGLEKKRLAGGLNRIIAIKIF